MEEIEEEFDDEEFEDDEDGDDEDESEEDGESEVETSPTEDQQLDELCSQRSMDWTHDFTPPTPTWAQDKWAELSRLWGRIDTRIRTPFSRDPKDKDRLQRVASLLAWIENRK